MSSDGQSVSYSASSPLLTIVVPVYNESQQLESVVEVLMKTELPIECEWIFIDDHSTDDSLAILNRLAEVHGFAVITQPVNKGKGAAIRRGIHAARGEFIAIQDADFEYDPDDLGQLVAPLIAGEADVVYGSRFKKSSVQVHRTWHYLVNRLLTMLSNMLAGIYLTDMETCYKLWRADLLKAMNLRSDRFGIEIEMTAYLARTRARIVELPIRYYPRTRLQGKKITWKDGVAALWHLIRFNMFTSDERAFTALPANYISPGTRRPPATRSS